MSKKLIVYLWLLLTVQMMYAQTVDHTIEFGPTGGISFYMGDANRQIFADNRSAFGGLVRYSFNPRLAAKLVIMQQQIAGQDPTGLKFSNSLTYLGIHGEFNFYSFEQTNFVLESSQVTPYILGGVGVVSTNVFAPVISCGVGGKWKLSEHINLNLEWTMNKAFTDNLEDVSSLNNPYMLNKSSFFNDDFFSSLTIAITFSFSTKRCDCRQGILRRY
jgi:hypothetical protein